MIKGKDCLMIPKAAPYPQGRKKSIIASPDYIRVLSTQMGTKYEQTDNDN